MKYIKKVLFMMTMLVPLVVFGMDKFEIVDDVKERAITQEHYDNDEYKVSYKADLNKYHATFNKQECEQNVYKKNAQKLGTVSLFSWFVLGSSCIAQKYDRSGATSDPKFLATQYALVGSAFTTSMLAINQMWKAHPKITVWSLFPSWKKSKEQQRAQDNDREF